MGDYRNPKLPISKESLDAFSKAFRKEVPMDNDEDKDKKDIESRAKIDALKKLKGDYQ